MKIVSIWVPIGLTLFLIAIGLTAPRVYAVWIDGEIGFLEIAQLVPPAIALGMAVTVIRDPRSDRERGLRLWMLALALVCIYLIGEEASWGQHYLGWGTPEWIAEVNRQEETNLHNTSRWLNEKPRSLFEIGVIVGGIIHPLLVLWRGRGLVERPWWLAPSVACLPSAILAELWRLPERVVEIPWLRASLAPTGADEAILGFARYSEVQEFYFFYFIMLYVLGIRRRLRTKPIEADGVEGANHQP